MSLVRAEDVDKFKDESAMVAGVTMGAQKGSYQQKVADTLYPDCTGRYLETIPNVIMDLKAGNIDILMLSKMRIWKPLSSFQCLMAMNRLTARQP